MRPIMRCAPVRKGRRSHVRAQTPRGGLAGWRRAGAGSRRSTEPPKRAQIRGSGRSAPHKAICACSEGAQIACTGADATWRDLRAGVEPVPGPGEAQSRRKGHRSGAAVDLRPIMRCAPVRKGRRSPVRAQTPRGGFAGWRRAGAGSTRGRGCRTGQHVGGGASRKAHTLNSTQRTFARRRYSSSLYPNPRTVTSTDGSAGFGSIFERSRFTCTSRVFVSPT